MGLDRDELAARFAVNAYTGGRDREARETLVAGAFDMADTFLGWRDMLAASKPALTPTPPPRESGTGGKYEPKVGDVCSNTTYTIVFTGFRPDGGMNGWILSTTLGYSPRFGEWSDWQVKQFAFIRPATASERAAAGLPPAPAPVAERPTHVRIVTTTSPLLKAGEVRRVKRWDDTGAPWVEHREFPSAGHVLRSDSTWEPCPPPPPADARGEAYKALLAYAECAEADGSMDTSVESFDAMLDRHGRRSGEASWDFMDRLRTRALSLARKAEGGAA